MSDQAVPDHILEYLEALLNISVQVADFQFDDTSREGIIAMVETLADHFGIERNYVEIEVDEEGTTTARIVDVDSTDHQEPESDEDPPTTVH